jgi:5-methylcytosine-specific restriction protein A
VTNARSDDALEYRRLYDTAAWRRLRLWKLRKDPLCRLCKEQGILTPATVVNHRTPHKGDVQLFFDTDNLESVCKTHHDSAIQSEERTGITRGCDVDGNPLDRASHWHKTG